MTPVALKQLTLQLLTVCVNSAYYGNVVTTAVGLTCVQKQSRQGQIAKVMSEQVIFSYKPE